jgi:catechol 2,3-dioxygenase-like lactoylglutathione lyase family enzyme
MGTYGIAVPVIGTRDVAGTVAWFENTLGFEQQWIWGEPPVYAGVKRGEATLYIAHDPELAEAIADRSLKPDIFLWVTEIDRVYQRHQEAGARMAEPLSTRSWGVRQYVIEEPNGYRLKIAESI